ncbi:MAG: response regulator transcription factor [Polyangiaceae bacterium]|nr:response regulator transcription factor [Polyangiaceae bacterium]
MGNDKKRILVVEDDESITVGLTLNLEAEGYAVEVAPDGEQGLTLGRARRHDLVVLDLMLPRLNGFEVLRTLRREGVETPVILLSARGAEIDKVMGLEFGAEDYVTKPFALAEFLARVKAVLRRDAIARPGVVDRVCAGNIEVNPATREVTRDGQPVALTATEFDVLWCLVEARGRVLSRDQIRDRVWGPGHHGTKRTIDNFVLQLRQKLEVDESDPILLVTVRGVGYRFAG